MSGEVKVVNIALLTLGVVWLASFGKDSCLLVKLYGQPYTLLGKFLRRNLLSNMNSSWDKIMPKCELWPREKACLSLDVVVGGSWHELGRNTQIKKLRKDDGRSTTECCRCSYNRFFHSMLYRSSSLSGRECIVELKEWAELRQAKYV